MAAKKIALFIDADNVSPRFGKQIFDSLTNRGEIFIRRIYGNWEKNTLHGWNECILNFALRPVQQIDFVAGKNATDMSLTIDAMDVLYGGQTEIFALVSNDSDFTPLVIRLREGGMTVVGLGNGHAANTFRLACDEFVDLDAFAEVPAPVEVQPVEVSRVEVQPVEKILPVEVSRVEVSRVEVSPVEVLPVPVVTSPKVVSISERRQQSDRDKKLQQIHDVLHEATRVHGDATGFLPLNDARLAIRDKQFDFSVKDFGYETLREFISAFPKLYETANADSSQLFRYRCLTVTPIPAVKKISPQDKKIRQIHATLREVVKNHRDQTGFALLSLVGDYLKKKNLSIKASGYSTIKNFVDAFPKLYETRTAGKIVRYRCR